MISLLLVFFLLQVICLFRLMMRTKPILLFSHEDSMLDHDLQSSHSAAADFIGSNDDLLTEILLWLPVISILRFKCVSKQWRSLLSHPTFTRWYDTRHFHHNLGLFTYDDDVYIPFDTEDRTTPPFRNLDFFSDPNGIRILQSCNGLLLCCSYCCPHYDRQYYVFNPTTRQFVIIPSVPGGIAVHKMIYFMGLAFHQTTCPHYKVVCVLKLDDKPVGEEEEEEELFQIQTYSSDTHKWKISVESLSARKSIFLYGVYWNGAINWALNDHGCLYFKVDVEQLHSVPLPVDTENIHLRESRDHLHLVARNYHDDNILHLKVYEMSMDHSGWFVKYKLELDEQDAFPGMIGLSVNVIDVIRGEADEDTFIVLLIDMKLITYNVHHKSFKEMFKFDNNVEGGISLYYNYYYRYAQTLASV